MGFPQFSQSRNGQAGGDVGSSQPNAPLFTQPETILSQKACLDQLVKEILDFKQDELTMDFQTAVKLLGVILKSGFNFKSNKHVKVVDDASANQIIQSLHAIKRLVIQVPEILSTQVDNDEVNSVMYEWLLTRVLTLYTFSSRRVNTQIGLFIKSLLIATASTAELWKLTGKIHSYLLQISSQIYQYLDSSVSTTTTLPEPLDQLSLTDTQTLEISLTILQAFLRAASASSNFRIAYDRAKFLQLKTIATKLWLLLKAIPSDNQHELHSIFANICSLALSVTLGRQSWVLLTTHWLLHMNKLALREMMSPDIDITAASLALDLTEYALKYGTSTVLIKPSVYENLMQSKVQHTAAQHYYLCRSLLALANILSEENPSLRHSIIRTHLKFENSFLNTKTDILCLTLKKTHIDSTIETGTDQSSQMQILFNSPFIRNPIRSTDDLKFFVETEFLGLSEVHRIWVVQRIGLSTCLLHGFLNMDTLVCAKCQKGTSSIEAHRMPSTVYTQILLAIVKSQNFQDYVLLQLETIYVLRRALAFVDLDFDIDLENELGYWLISCFRSSVRQLRLATSSLLPYCITSKQRFQEIFNLLSQIDFSKEMHLTESVIQAWGQLAQVSEGERLNLILMKLIEILGSEKSIHSTLSCYQLQSIARFRDTTCLELMSPFWPTISVSVLKRHISQPQIIPRLTTLLSITPKDFFSRTRKYTVPYMVLTKRMDVLELISEALVTPIEKLILENISKTVAVLLMHESDDIGSFVMSTLAAVHRPMKRLDLSRIVIPHRLDIVFEVLKLHDPDDDERSRKIDLVLKFLENLLYETEKKKSALINPEECFFDVNILGVATLFATEIRGNGSNLPFTEKIQCLRGISKLIFCSGHSFAKSVPQICTLLQAAMDTQELQVHAMIAWLDMIKVMARDGLERIMDLTFSIVIQKWSSMTAEAKAKAHDLLKYLFSKQRNEMNEIIRAKGVPYLSGLLPDLKDIYEEICRMIKRSPPISPLKQLKLLLERGLDDNIYIVRQTVQEISEFLLKEQECVRQVLTNEGAQIAFSRLLRLLLNIPNEFQHTNSDISYLCAQCIGFLGAIDPSKVDITDSSPGIVVIHNFTDVGENIKFVLHFVEHHLLKGFEASTNPYYQSFLAYGIQEYLKFCKLQPTTITTGPEKDAWSRLSPNTQTILFPLLSSRYRMNHSTSMPEVVYPIFSIHVSHSKWLQSFAMDLLGKVEKGCAANNIFKLCRKIIRDQESSIFNFVLPYVTLHVIISGTDSDRENILSEILNILNTDPSDLQENTNQLDNLKRSYGTVFSMIDYFNQSLRARQSYLTNKRTDKEKEKVKKTAKSSLKLLQEENDVNVNIIKTFLQRIPADIMATRSFECKSYSRSLMYWEEHLRENTSESSEESEKIYSKFMEIYASIDDPDSLDGIASNVKLLSVPGKILYYENTGKWDYALECYEVLSKTSEWNVELNFNMLRCIKESGRYEDLLARLDAVSLEQSELPTGFQSLGIEAALLTGEFEKLELWLKRSPMSNPAGNNFEVNLGWAIIALSKSNFEDLWAYMDKARQGVSKILESSPVTSVMQSQEAMIRLHGLADLESIGSLAQSFNRSRTSLTQGSVEPVDHRTMSRRLNERLDILGANFDAKRYLLALRRSAMKATE